MNRRVSSRDDDGTDHDDLQVAVVHGNYVGRGGGEHVAEHLARAFDAPLYYGFGDEANEPDGIDCRSLFDDRRFGGIIKRVYQLRDLYYMQGFRSVPELHEYDVVIQSGNEPGWYVPPDDQVVVKYTHSPPRNAYDRYPQQASESGPIFELYTFVTQQLYRANLAYPDLYVANSEVIARRIDRYWGIDGDRVRVVYPPIDTNWFGPEHATGSRDEYYLVLDRLEPTKHVDSIVEAFADRPGARLVVAGTGSMETALRAQAANTDADVEFRGYVSESEKRALLAEATALCYAAEDEDFGIVPIEAMASGTPVIGPREGFTQYQIDDGANGLLYGREGGGIAGAFARFEREGVSMTTAELEAFTERFGMDVFRRELRAVVAEAVERAEIGDRPVTVEPNTAADTLLTSDGGQPTREEDE